MMRGSLVEVHLENINVFIFYLKKEKKKKSFYKWLFTVKVDNKYDLLLISDKLNTLDHT